VSESPLRYAALIEKPDDFKVGPVSSALAAWKKVPAADMLLPARHSWGILAEGEAQPAAEALVAELGRHGAAAFSVPTNLIEEPPAVSTAAEFAAAPGGRLVLLAAAAFKRTTSKTVKSMEGPSASERAVRIGLMAAGLPIGLGGGQREVVKTVEESDLVFYADLILKDPVERLRVDARAFDYSFLGARKDFNTTGNFRILLSVLAEAAPRALLNRGCRYLREGKPVREMGYEGLEDLDREERWLLTLAALKKL
jgi:hypothetical protein